MPKEYLDCVKAVEKSGKVHKDAQRICAIQYYKKHGKTPNQGGGESLVKMGLLPGPKASEEGEPVFEEGYVFNDYEMSLFKALDTIGPVFVDTVANVVDVTPIETEVGEAVVEAAVWTTAFVNNLPDSCFLYIEPGGKKVGGKTEPRSLRHLPYKGSDGKIDMPHLRNAISRIPQMKGISPAMMKSLQTKARGMMPKGGSASEQTLIEQYNEVCDAFNEKFRNLYSGPVDSPSSPNIKDVFADYLICEGIDDKLYQVGYKVDASGEVTFDETDKWIEVVLEKNYVPVSESS